MGFTVGMEWGWTVWYARGAFKTEAALSDEGANASGSAVGKGADCETGGWRSHRQDSVRRRESAGAAGGEEGSDVCGGDVVGYIIAGIAHEGWMCDGESSIKSY